MLISTLLLAAALSTIQVGAIDPPSPASGHAAVVAQGLVAFASGEQHWAAVRIPIATEGTAVEGPAFVVAGAPGAILVGPSGSPLTARLAPGEALFHGASDPIEVRSSTASGAEVTVITIEPGTGTDAFTPGAGIRDVDLVRDVLNPNEALLLNTEVSALVVVTAGLLSAGDTMIGPDAPVALSGDITLINRGTEQATIVAAVIGPTVGGDIPVATDLPGGPSAPLPPGTNTTAPSPTTPQSTAVQSSTTSTSATTTEAVADSDGDGLTDGQESSQFGTDPNAADSDGDGLDDGREVNAIGSNPLDTDSDSDALTDGLEIDHSCDPQVPDTDGDNLVDAFEANAGGSECSVSDTDGDGFDDGEEFSLGTGRRDPDSHP